MLAEDVREGFVVQVANLGPHVVSRVEEYEDGTLVVVYFRHGETCYENSARHRGMRVEPRLVERSLAPMRRGESVRCERGDAKEAKRLRGEMLLAQAERDAATEQRWSRQGRRHAP